MPSPRDLVATPYRRGVLVLALITMCWRAWTVSRWSWQDDDWLFVTSSQSMSFWEFLWHDHNSHIMPGGFLVTKMLLEVFLLDFRPVVVLVAVMCAVIVLIWGHAFGLLTQDNPVALLPLAVLALTPVAMKPMMWWACSVNAIPLQLATGLMIVWACHWSQRRQRAHLVLLVATFIIGLLFWQKVLFATIPLAFVLLALARGGARQRIRQAWVPLAWLAGVATSYLVLYLYLTRGVNEGSVETTFSNATPSQALDDLGRAFTQVVLPSLLGGPWGTVSEGDPNRRQAAIVTASVCLLLGVGVVWLARRRPQCLWLLLLPVFYSGITMAILLFSSREQSLGDIMVVDHYHVDGVMAAALAAVLVLREVQQRRSKAGWRLATDRAGLVVTAGAASLIGSLILSNIWHADQLGVNGGRSWVTAVHQNLSAATKTRASDDPLVLLDAQAPNDVMSYAFWVDQARLSRLLSPFEPRVQFERASDQIWGVTDTGDVEPLRVDASTRALEGPTHDCGYAIKAGDQITVPLAGSLFAWQWGVELTSFSSSATQLEIEMPEDTLEFSIPEGVRSRVIAYTGEVPESLLVRSVGAEGTICLTGLSVGNFVPKSG